MSTDPGILCSLHQRALYEDTRDGKPMGRYLCPGPGCTSVPAADTLAAMRDQAWCQANGMTAPGWQTPGEAGGQATAAPPTG